MSRNATEATVISSAYLSLFEGGGGLVEVLKLNTIKTVNDVFIGTW
jgi:hypothetical protein